MDFFDCVTFGVGRGEVLAVASFRSKVNSWKRHLEYRNRKILVHEILENNQNFWENKNQFQYIPLLSPVH